MAKAGDYMTDFGWDPQDELGGGQDPAPPAPQPQAPDQFEQDLTALYGKYGRNDLTPDIVQAHRGNPQGLAGVENMLIQDWTPPPAAAPTPGPTPGPITRTGGGGGGGSTITGPPPVRMDSSAQPITQNNPSYDALNQLLMQMFSAQQQRDTENANYRSNIRGGILDRLKTVSQPKTMQSPEINAQSKAYRAASERNLRSNKEALAERAHAQGLPSGAQDTGVQSAYTSARREQSGYDAKLLGDSLTQQRDELDRLLLAGQGAISADDVASINSYRDQIDAQLRQISTQQAGSLGQQDVDLRSVLGLGSLGLQGQSIGNQNDQFNAGFGLQFGNSQWEHEYLMKLLGLK